MARTLLEHLSDAELGQVAEEMADVYERAMRPSDAQIIAKMVYYGCPRKAAERQMKHSGLSLYARQFYVDAEDAEHGDPEAKKRLEQIKAGWRGLNEQTARRAQDYVKAK